MWYEILPPMVIISVGLYIPTVAGKLIHTLMFGNPFRRDMTEGFARTMACRDCRISGAPWNTTGLENIPDEPKTQ